MKILDGCDNIVRYMRNFMEAALEEARKAMAMGEVPVGAVIVKDGRILGRGHNLTESTKDPTAHAELIAIREAAAALGGWRLIGCTMFVTVEPCSMCAGALVWSRMEKLYIGTMDPKSGGCGSIFNITGDNRLNHQVDITSGVLAEECAALLKSFFEARRKKQS